MIPRTYLQVSCVLSTLATSSLFLARGTGDLIASEVVQDGALAAAPELASAAELEPPPGKVAPDPRAILARNIFDPQTGSLWPPPEEEPVVEEEVIAEPEPAVDPRCETQMRIAAAFYNDRSPERSWVVLRGPEIGSRPYGLGMVVGKHTVGVIEPKGVRLDREGESCWLGMFNEHSREKVKLEQRTSRISKAKAKAKEKKKKRKKRKRRPRRTSVKSPFSSSELRAGIRKVDSTKYVVKDELFDKAVENVSNIARSTRLAPVRNGKEVVGMRLLRIRRGGLLSRIGLKRGDVLRTVNGYEVGEPDDMLTAYSQLPSADRITVAVRRGRRFLNLEYRVQ